MARSSFSGGGDYSSLFGSLYSQAKALKNSQQDAADQDAYDRWKNGLMSDEQWLAYIQTRVDATSSDKDPGDHQHWIQLQRQYVTSIADSQAEYAFSQGTASINELISYYQGRLGRLQEDSDEYRQLKGHVSDLIDKRDADDLSTGAQDISARIDRGKATYQDLLKFYQSHLGKLRPGSELYKQVASEITKVKGTIADTKLNGEFERLQYLYESKKISGRAYASKLEAMAAPYKASDPAKYYQLLQAANRIRKAGGTGGGGGGGGGGAGPSLTKHERAIEEQLKATDNYLEQFTDAYKKGARVIPDPANPGKTIVLSPELIAEVDHQRLANFDKLAALYKGTGAKSKYTSTLQYKTKYIVNVVQPHNTVAASHQWGQLVGSLSKQIEANADNPDTESTLKGVVSGLQSMKAWLQGEVVKNGKVVKAESQPTGDFLQATSDFVDQTIAILSDPEMDSATRMAAVDDLSRSLDTDAGAHYDKGTQTAMRALLSDASIVASASYDLATGKKVAVITPGEGITLKDVRIQHTLGADPETGQTMSIDLPSPDVQLEKGQRIQEVWIDRGGTPTKVFAVVDSAPSPYQVWVASRAVTIGGRTFAAGAAIPSDQLAGSSFQDAVRSGAIARKDAFEAAGTPLNYIAIPAYDDNGQHHDAVTFYQDPQTKLWHKGQPPISSASLNDDGTLKVGDDGKYQINWMPFSNAAGVAVPYGGQNSAAMQRLFNQGQVGTDPRYNEQGGYRDYSGQYTTDPTKSLPSGQYFDFHDESARGVNMDRILRQEELDRIEHAKAIAGAENRPSFDPETDVLRMAKTLGIDLGGADNQKKVNAMVPGPTPGILEARRNALLTSGAAPKVTLSTGATRPTFDLPQSARNTSSGPALADLPGAHGTSIDPNKVVALSPDERDEANKKSTPTKVTMPKLTVPISDSKLSALTKLA